MKKRIVSILLTAIMIAVSFSALTACGKDDKVIKIGASPTPHAEILNNAVKPLIEEQGYKLEVAEYNDYIVPNTSTESGDLFANYFQHGPYLDDFNKENKTHLVSIAAVHYEPLGIYAGKSSSIENVAKGSVIAVPNDTTNEARALLLLEDNGLIKLKEGAGITATVLDIEDNPFDLEIKEIEAAQIPRVLDDVDFGIINGNYAINGGLSVDDALAIETADSEAAQTYANVLVVKEGNEDSKKAEILKEAILSEEVKDYIADNYGGAVVAIF